MFLPQTGAQIVQLDGRVRARLAKSLQYLFDKSLIRDHLADAGSHALVDLVAAHRQRPSVYARYFELVFALRNGHHETAATLWREMAALALEPPSFAVQPLTEQAMGGDAALYARLLDGGAPDSMFAPPDAVQWAGFDKRVLAALDILDDVDAVLAEEIKALVCEVIGALPGTAGRAFGGVSSLTLWGALVLNIERHRTLVDLIEGLVHESAHLLLFAYAAEEPLVTNATDERYASPLRVDPRPMDGVFHATFVCARLHLLYRKLVENDGSVLESSREIFEQRLALQRRQFGDGAQVVAGYAKLTKTGERVLQATMDYMTNDAA